jgi:hypothetical protein
MGDSGPLVFNLARLRAPDFSLDQPVRFQLQQDLVQDDLAVQRSSMPVSSAAATFASRVEAAAARPAAGGLLTLPQSFGAVYLGQAFAAIITVANYSDMALTAVGLKVCMGAGRSRRAGEGGTPFRAVPSSGPTPASACPQVELATERSRLAVLHDSTAAPLPSLAPGQRSDFLVRHDVKDLVGGGGAGVWGWWWRLPFHLHSSAHLKGNGSSGEGDL